MGVIYIPALPKELRSWHTGKFSFESSFRKWLSKENFVCVMKTSRKFSAFESSFQWLASGKFSFANNNIEWTGDKVLHLIDVFKDVPALYVVDWIYVGRSRVSCLCAYACTSAVLNSSSSDVQTPTLQPLAYLRSMITSTQTDACICKLHLYILTGCGKEQTRNDRLFIAMRIVCHCLLKTFDGLMQTFQCDIVNSF